jgi:hypothetical protein
VRPGPARPVSPPRPAPPSPWSRPRSTHTQSRSVPSPGRSAARPLGPRLLRTASSSASNAAARFCLRQRSSPGRGRASSRAASRELLLRPVSSHLGRPPRPAATRAASSCRRRYRTGSSSSDPPHDLLSDASVARPAPHATVYSSPARQPSTRALHDRRRAARQPSTRAPHDRRPARPSPRAPPVNCLLERRPATGSSNTILQRLQCSSSARAAARPCRRKGMHLEGTASVMGVVS